MRTITKHVWATLSLMCVVLLLSATFAACSDSNDPKEPNKPDTPVNTGDDMTVSASGGTITKGDISITFPSGTFDSDTKVTITEVKKGETLGEDEASTFYQVKMPVSASRPMTISIKSEKQSEDIRFVTNVSSHSLHDPDIMTSSPISYEVSYSDGHYTATLPSFDNANEDGEIGIAMGLGHIVQFSSSVDLEQTSATRLDIKGETEGDISWHYEVGIIFYTAFYSRLQTVIPQINLFMHEAVREITRLGFTVDEKRDIPILFKTLYEPGEDVVWGVFMQHPTNDAKSWIELDTKLLTQFDSNKDDVKQTVFHELLHYFQAAYDTRTPFGKQYTGDELMLYEAGGRWIEKFANNGIPPSENFTGLIGRFLMGLLDIEEIYKKEPEAQDERIGKWVYNLFGNDGRVFSINKARRYHGYAMASLLEYFSKEYGDDKIVDLYSDWRKNSKSSLQSTFNALKTFATAKGSTVFSGTYDYFIEEILTGRLLPSVNITHAWIRERLLNPDHTSYDEVGTCYPYGADIVWYPMSFPKDYSFDGKELVILNNSSKDSYLHTTIYTKYNIKNITLNENPILPGDSLVIPTETLKLLGYNSKQSGFFLVTSGYHESGKESSNIKVEIRSAPETLNNVITMLDFDFNVKSANEAGKTRNVGGGLRFDDETNAKFKVTRTDNRMHVECSAIFRDEWNEQIYTDYNVTLSFDINEFSHEGRLIRSNAITNCKYECSSTHTEFGATSNYYEKVEIANIPWYSYSVWMGMASSGVKFSNYYWDDGEYTLVDDPNNTASIQIEFSSDFLK